MEILVERLDAKLREWRPDIADLVKRRIAEIIDLADQDVLDILRSRTVEQEVLDLLDKSWLGEVYPSVNFPVMPSS